MTVDRNELRYDNPSHFDSLPGVLMAGVSRLRSPFSDERGSACDAALKSGSVGLVIAKAISQWRLSPNAKSHQRQPTPKTASEYRLQVPARPIAYRDPTSVGMPQDRVGPAIAQRWRRERLG